MTKLTLAQGEKPKKKNPWIKWDKYDGNMPKYDSSHVLKYKMRNGRITICTYDEIWFGDSDDSKMRCDVTAYKDMSHKYIWDEKKQKIVKKRKSKDE